MNKHKIISMVFFIVLCAAYSLAQSFPTTTLIYYGKIGEYPVEMRIDEVLAMDGAAYRGSYKYLKVGQEIELNFHANENFPLLEEPRYDIEDGRVKVKEFIGKKHTGTFWFDKQYFGKDFLEKEKTLKGYWHSPDEKRILRFELNLVKYSSNGLAR